MASDDKNVKLIVETHCSLIACTLHSKNDDMSHKERLIYCMIFINIQIYGLHVDLSLSCTQTDSKQMSMFVNVQLPQYFLDLNFLAKFL